MFIYVTDISYAVELDRVLYQLFFIIFKELQHTALPWIIE